MENSFSATIYPNRIEAIFTWRKPRHDTNHDKVMFYDKDAYAAFKKFLGEPSLTRLTSLADAFNWNVSPFNIDRDRAAFKNEVFIINLLYYLDFSKTYSITETDRTVEKLIVSEQNKQGEQ